MDNDFATPEAQAVLFEIAHEINRHKLNNPERAASLAAELKLLGGLLGLLTRDPESYFQAGAEGDIDTAQIDTLIAKRQEAKANKDYAEADRIRDELQAMGILLEDTPAGTKWRRN